MTKLKSNYIIDATLLNEFFINFFGYHTVAIGLPLMYLPYTYTVIVAWLHFIG